MTTRQMAQRLVLEDDGITARVLADVRTAQHPSDDLDDSALTAQHDATRRILESPTSLLIAQALAVVGVVEEDTVQRLIEAALRLEDDGTTALDPSKGA